MIEHDRHQRLHARHARGAVGIGLGLLFQRMGRVVGAQNIRDALPQPPPDMIAMARLAHGRIHLQLRAERRIEARVEGQMMGRDLHARHILVVFQKVDLLARRHMQHMDQRALFTSDLHEALRAAQRCLHIAPDRVRMGIALHPDRLALIQPIFVLRMEGGAAARLRQNRRHPRIILHQQRAGRRAHEDLDARRPRQALQLRHVLGVLVGAAHPEGEIAVHAMQTARNLVGEGLGGGRQRIGVRHFEHRRHPAQHSRARARLQIFLMGQARLAKMHLGVDDPRQDMQPRAVDALPGARLREIADGGDAPARNAHIALALAIVVDERSVFENVIIGL